jgi:hypothetical protein
MKTFILDVAKWKSGYREYEWGEGETSLLNSQNYMCCLGQFGLQCNLKRKDIVGGDSPEDVDCDAVTEEFSIFLNKNSYSQGNNQLSTSLIDINDSEKNIFTRIQDLHDRLQLEGIELVVKNLDPWAPNGWLKDSYFKQLLTKDMWETVDEDTTPVELKRKLSGISYYHKYYFRTYKPDEIVKQATRLYKQPLGRYGDSSCDLSHYWGVQE